MPEIIKFDDPVVLIGGGEVDIQQLTRLSSFAVVAADGGANYLRHTTVMPELIIGDLDSLEESDYWQSVTTVKNVAEQDTTDLEKCLYSVEAPYFIALGFLGGRFDHSLASLHVLQKYHCRKQVVLVGSEDIVIVCSDSISYELPVQTRVSVYPMGKVSFTSSCGLKYPLDGLVMQQGEQIGTSNITCEEKFEIQADDGCFVLILPVEHLPAVLVQIAE